MSTASRVLYVAACAAPPASDVGALVELAHADGWDVCVVATPSALNFPDVAKLGAQTGDVFELHGVWALTTARKKEMTSL